MKAEKGQANWGTAYEKEETIQFKLDGTPFVNFEDKWGMSRFEAMNDREWISERLEEGWDLQQFCDAWSISEEKLLLLLNEKLDKSDYPIGGKKW